MTTEAGKAPGKRNLTILNVDLNLLVVLQALLEEKSVTRAANRVCLSQSATSSALARLRSVFDDPLLVRWSNKMELSRRGMELQEPVNQAIAAINEVLGEPLAFDPQLAHTTVRISASDYVGVALLPALERELQLQSPGISLYMSPLREPEALRRLERDDVDLVIGNFPDTPNLSSSEIFHEKFVCLMRDQHPLLKEVSGEALSLKQFTTYPHVAISREGVQHDMIDLMLSEYDFERTIGIHVPHFLVAPSIVARNDMIVVEARRVALSFKDTFGLAIVGLPLEFGPTELPIHMVWEPHTEEDPCLQWVRGLIQQVAQNI
ncbi:MAG: LysR family transcriptional regulator [Halioglobus sp.]